MNTKFKKINSIVLSATMVLSSPLYAARGGEETVTTTTVPAAIVPPVTGTGTASIQNAAKNSSNSNTMGMVLGVGAAAFCTYKAVKECGSQNYAMCALYIAGVGASLYVVSTMTKSKNKSAETCNDVSIGGCSNGSRDENLLSGGPGQTFNPEVQTDYNRVLETVTELERTTGARIDRQTGRVTLPNGRTLETSNLSNSSLSSAGIDPKGFADMMGQAQKSGETYASTKGVDNNSDSFGDIGGGGGGSSGTYSAETMGAAGSGLGKSGAGLPRDPAQVSGMAVNYNGESIGVGPDNLFKMIHRRYDLHKTKGNFIGEAK